MRGARLVTRSFYSILFDMRILVLFVCAVALNAAVADLRLIEAVQKGDQKKVLALLKAGAKVNEARPDGSTALAWSVSREDSEISGALVSSGANVNAADENGETPLGIACGLGNLGIAKLLLEAKADPNRARWNGETPLMGAVTSKNVELVKLMVAAGAKVDVMEARSGQTALMWAAVEGKKVRNEIEIVFTLPQCWYLCLTGHLGATPESTKRAAELAHPLRLYLEPAPQRTQGDSSGQRKGTGTEVGLPGSILREI